MKSIFLLFLLATNNIGFADFLPQKCAANQHWVRAHHRRAYFRTNGTYVSATDVTAHCADNPKSYDYWKPKLKSKLPKDWPLKEKAAKWSEEEIERVLEALSELPDSLLEKSIQGIYRATKSKNYPNPASSRDNQIVLYDTIFGELRNLSRILAHELSHEVYRNLSKEDQIAYQTATNWFAISKRNKEKVWIRRKSGYVESDGILSPAEDFANNVEYFLFQPAKLRKITPTAYDWIMHRFGKKFKLENSQDDK